MDIYDEEDKMTGEVLSKLIRDMDEGESDDLKNKAAGVTITIGVAPGVDQEVLDAAKSDVVGSDEEKEKMKRELGI